LWNALVPYSESYVFLVCVNCGSQLHLHLIRRQRKQQPNSMPKWHLRWISRPGRPVTVHDVSGRIILYGWNSGGILSCRHLLYYYWSECSVCMYFVPRWFLLWWWLRFDSVPGRLLLHCWSEWAHCVPSWKCRRISRPGRAVTVHHLPRWILLYRRRCPITVCSGNVFNLHWTRSTVTVHCVPCWFLLHRWHCQLIMLSGQLFNLRWSIIPVTVRCLPRWLLLHWR
jgi:hypothetical protein